MDGSPPQDEETLSLVRRAQSDDQRAVEALFARFLPRVRRTAAVRLGKTAHHLVELDDLVQEAMMDALHGLQTFDMQSDGRFCNWLARIVENRLRKSIRFQRAQKRGSGDVQRFSDADQSIHGSRLEGFEPTPSQHYAAVEAEERVEQALLGMPSQSREILAQRLFCKMSYDEIAEELDLGSRDSARAIFSRALRDLNQRMG